MKISRVLLAVYAMTAFGFSHAEAATIPIFSKYPAIDRSIWYISNGWANSSIQSCEWRATALSAVDKRLRITLNDKGGKVRPIGCGELQSTKRYSYGAYEVSMKSAAGSGLNSNIFTYVGKPLAPVHGEIDFEFQGKDPTTVQVNYWVNNKNMGAKTIKLGFDASKAFHTYKFVWEPTRITWFIDGKQVHQTKPGAPIPKEPQKIYLSLWSGSDQINGWLGKFKYTQPVWAEYEWVKFTPMPNIAAGPSR
jgi:endo-1,3-1,4-beta-glycanase ExoK